MKILAISDIHNRVECVHELRRREANDYAAVIVAGDIGVEKAGAIFDVLKTFDCPVAYIGGNWDFKMPLDADFGTGVHHLTKGPLVVGDWHFVGIDYPMTIEQLQGDRSKLATAVSTLPASRTVVVAHERLTRTSQDMPGIALHLYGHMHRFEDKTHRGSRFVNVSALGEITTVARDPVTGPKSYRNALRGAYVAIDLGAEIQISSTRFRQTTNGWTPVTGTWPAALALNPIEHPFVDD